MNGGFVPSFGSVFGLKVVAEGDHGSRLSAEEETGHGSLGCVPQTVRTLEGFKRPRCIERDRVISLENWRRWLEG